MNIPTRQRQPSLVEGVCTQLSSIIRSEIADGDGWLPPERQLAAKLGVSRPVVREATKRLELQGLVEVRHGIGTKVVDKLHKPLSGSLSLLVPDTQDRLRQLTEVRLALEPENARLAASRATSDQITGLRAIHERHAAAKTIETSAAADMDFHRAIAAASGNQIAALLIQSLSEIFQASLLHGYQRVASTQALADHWAVIEGISARDSEAAAQAMKKHITHASADLGL